MSKSQHTPLSSLTELVMVLVATVFFVVVFSLDVDHFWKQNRVREMFRWNSEVSYILCMAALPRYIIP